MQGGCRALSIATSAIYLTCSASAGGRGHRGLQNAATEVPHFALPVLRLLVVLAPACACARTPGGRAGGTSQPMILSARWSSAGGTVTPRLLAVLRLMTSSNFVGCSTGRSP